VSIADDLRKADREVKKLLADVGGANTPEMRAAARQLAKSIRKQLSKRGSRTDRSKPGEPPRRESGKAVKSIGIEVVGGVVRVGTGRFTLRILQDGAQHAPRGAEVDRAGKRRHKRKTLKRPSVTIAPRPFMEKALADALPQMEGDFVGELQKRSRTGG
jgi:hypothetical protein